MRSLRDAARCEVCGQLYRVPPEAVAGWEAANGGAAAPAAHERRLLSAWQAVRPVLLWAARASVLGVRVAIALRHCWLWLNQAAYLAVEAEYVPQVGLVGFGHGSGNRAPVA